MRPSRSSLAPSGPGNLAHWAQSTMGLVGDADGAYDRTILFEFVEFGGGLSRHVAGPHAMTWQFTRFIVREYVHSVYGVSLHLDFLKEVDAEHARGLLSQYDVDVRASSFESRVTIDGLVLSARWNSLVVRRELVGILALLCGLASKLRGGADAGAVGISGRRAPEIG